MDWKKYMGFSINNKLSFLDRFQFLSSSLGSLVKNLNKEDIKYLSKNLIMTCYIWLSKKDFIPLNI